MLGQAVGITGKVEGEIRAYVGRFLQARASLTNLLESRDPAVSQRANKLFKRQLILEPELEKTLKTIDEMKEGRYSLFEIGKAANFSREMIIHVRKVEALAKGNKLELIAGIGGSPLIIVGGMALTALFVMKEMRRRRA